MKAEKKTEEKDCKCVKEVVKKVTINLNQGEYDALARFAKRDRRVVSAQAAEMLSDALEAELEEERFEAMPDPSDELTPVFPESDQGRGPFLDEPMAQAAEPKLAFNYKESGSELVDGDNLKEEMATEEL